MSKMVWDAKQNKMVAETGAGKEDTLKVSISITQYETLKEFAKQDGFDFKGISYETEKDKEGKTKKDKEGKPVFKLDQKGNKIVKTVEVSQGKVNSAVAEYVRVAVENLIAVRTAATPTK